MNITQIIDLEVMTHIAQFGCIKNMDPFAQHILKTSQEPLMRFRRDWMRRKAITSVLNATRDQKIMNEQLAADPVRRGAMRREAVVHPYFAEHMRRRDNASWGDPDYRRYVKREEPSIFPKREVI